MPPVSLGPDAFLLRTLRRVPSRSSALRTLSLFLALFSTVNLLGELVQPRFDATGWWLDLALLPAPLRALIPPSPLPCSYS